MRIKIQTKRHNGVKEEELEINGCLVRRKGREKKYRTMGCVKKNNKTIITRIFLSPPL